MRTTLWDMDGTLVDSAEGVIRCLQFALESKGLAVPKAIDLTWCLGPPLQTSFAQLVPEATDTEIWQLVDVYRQRYSKTGIFEARLYPGIREVLTTLNSNRNFVATSKLQQYAVQVIQHFQLSSAFRAIYGSGERGQLSQKGELIAHILASEALDPSLVTMVGDRHHDIDGAKRAGVRAIGVTWGYGSREELLEAGADDLCDTPAELLEILSEDQDR